METRLWLESRIGVFQRKKRGFINILCGAAKKRERITVLDPGEGVCVDPVNRDAILEGGGPGPQGGNKERQLSPGKGRGET